jgi:hypothetical protein
MRQLLAWKRFGLGLKFLQHAVYTVMECCMSFAAMQQQPDHSVLHLTVSLLTMFTACSGP